MSNNGNIFKITSNSNLKTIFTYLDYNYVLKLVKKNKRLQYRLDLNHQNYTINCEYTVVKDYESHEFIFKLIVAISILFQSFAWIIFIINSCIYTTYSEEDYGKKFFFLFFYSFIFLDIFLLITCVFEFIIFFFFYNFNVPEINIFLKVIYILINSFNTMFLIFELKINLDIEKKKSYKIISKFIIIILLLLNIIGEFTSIIIYLLFLKIKFNRLIVLIPI